MKFDQIITIVALLLALTMLSESGYCDLRFVVPNNYDIQLSDSEKADLAEILDNLVGHPSELILKSIDESTGTAVLIDHRANQSREHSLMAFIDYPVMSANENRTFQPRVTCVGTFEPATWEYCYESSDTYLNIPGHGQIHVDHETISVPSTQKMMAIVDSAGLKSPKGAPIVAGRIQTIQYIDRDGFYLIMGVTPHNEHYTVKMQPIFEDGVDTYEISEWSCR